MADKLFDDSEFYMKRFSCKCLHPCHIVDFFIEINEGNDYIDIDFGERYCGADRPFWGRWGRLGIALRYLFKGENIWGHGFLLRVEDIDDMVELLKKVKK